MRKSIISLALVLCMLLLMTSCDVVGGAVIDLIPDEIKGIVSEIVPGIVEKPDVPEDNIRVIVDKINNGSSISSVVKEQGAVENEEDIAEKIRQKLPEMCGDVNMTVTSNGEKVKAYAAIKNNVVFLASEENESYVFIEDDFKLVSVSGSKSEGYEGTVSDELNEALDSFTVNNNDEEIGEEDQQLSEFLSSVAEISLPYASEDDIIYRDGKYYVSDEYLENALRELSREILDKYYNVYPEETPDDIYDELEEGITDALKALDIKIWFNAKCEEITGIGYSVYAHDGDLAELSEDLDEIVEFGLFYDLNDTRIEFNLLCEGKEEYEKVDIKGVVETTLDENDELATASVTIDVTAPFSQSDYDDQTQINLRGATVVHYELNFDASKADEGGNVLKATFTTNTTDIKAYEVDYYSYDEEEEYSEELTEKYSKRKNKINFELTIDVEEGGEKFLALVVYNEKNTITNDKTDNSFSIRADLTTTAEKMPEVPKAVERAREDALEEFYESK